MKPVLWVLVACRGGGQEDPLSLDADASLFGRSPGAHLGESADQGRWGDESALLFTAPAVLNDVSGGLGEVLIVTSEQRSRLVLPASIPQSGNAARFIGDVDSDGLGDIAVTTGDFSILLYPSSAPVEEGLIYDYEELAVRGALESPAHSVGSIGDIVGGSTAEVVMEGWYGSVIVDVQAGDAYDIPHRRIRLAGDHVLSTRLEGQTFLVELTEQAGFAYEGEPSEPSFEVRSTLPGFGHVLALEAESGVLAVGAAEAGDGGRVFLYDRVSGDELGALSGEAEEGFGSAIAFANRPETSAPVLLVGAPASRAAASGGRVYLFDVEDLSEPLQVIDGPAPGSRFGSSIGASANEVWIGSPGVGERESGAVFRFFWDES